MTIPSLALRRTKFGIKFPSVHISRRSLQVSLGVVWLIDAILQAQPWMFSKAFGENVIRASAMGQPAIIAKPLMIIAEVVIRYPQLNVIFMLAQFAIAFGILFSRKTLKQALLASVIWGIGVWYVGDGLGGIFTGGGAMLAGFPTAPILYSIVSIVLWPQDSEALPLAQGESKLALLLKKIDFLFEKMGGSIARVSWSMLWMAGSLFALTSSQLKAGEISQEISASASASPGWLANIDKAILPGVRSLGIGLVLAIAVVELLIGLLALHPRSLKMSLWVGSIVSVAYWIFGQSLGAITTGESTDLNSAPLFILLAVVVYFQSRIRVSGAVVDKVERIHVTGFDNSEVTQVS